MFLKFLKLQNQKQREEIVPDSQCPLPSACPPCRHKKSRSKLLQALIHAFVLIMVGDRQDKKAPYPLRARGVTLSIHFKAAISQHSHFNTGQVGLSVGKLSYFHRTFVGLKCRLSIHSNTTLLPSWHYPNPFNLGMAVPQRDRPNNSIASFFRS